MEKITTKSEFVERLKDILAVEKLARKDYVQDLALFSHPQIVETISQIKSDEDRHIVLLSEIISLLE